MATADPGLSLTELAARINWDSDAPAGNTVLGMGVANGRESTYEEE